MALVVVVCTAAESRAEADFREFDQPPHDYFKRTPTDRFTRMRADLEAGRVQ
jgi:hypothetical protein